jgi:hypothetical protein
VSVPEFIYFYYLALIAWVFIYLLVWCARHMLNVGAHYAEDEAIVADWDRPGSGKEAA